MIAPWLINTAWMHLCRREAMAFDAATHDVAGVQARILRDTLRRNGDTEFGAAHRLGDCTSVAQFQQRVPLSTFEDYSPYMSRIAAGRANVLTRERVELLEPTSGTAGGEKLIPFTAALRRQFHRAVAAWMHDLLRHRPGLRDGQAYWSISPQMAPRIPTAGGLRIGFADDASYLGTITAYLARRTMAVPSAVSAIHNMEEFRFQTLIHLLMAADLRLISIWSPTFLTALLAPLEIWQDRLCAALPNRRSAEVKQILATAGPLSEKLSRLWPELTLISAWADAGAAAYLPELKRLLPSTEIQPKGLLATEGCVSFPLIRCEFPVVAVRSHFFEFQPSDAPDRIHLAHELDAGGRYRVILTTAGGLYRYQLCDEIEVCGFHRRCPMLRFLGKADCHSDMVGEKLAEPHVRAVLKECLAANHVQPRFAMLVPMIQSRRYRLYLQARDVDVTEFARHLEHKLQSNPHYRYARELGQLQMCELVVLDHAGASAWELYERHLVSQGVRAGSIKPMMLDARADWAEVFDPGV